MYIYCDSPPHPPLLSELARPQPPQYFSSICVLCWHFQVLSCTAGHPLFLCVTTSSDFSSLLVVSIIGQSWVTLDKEYLSTLVLSSSGSAIYQPQCLLHDLTLRVVIRLIHTVVHCIYTTFLPLASQLLTTRSLPIVITYYRENNTLASADHNVPQHHVLIISSSYLYLFTYNCALRSDNPVLCCTVCRTHTSSHVSTRIVNAFTNNYISAFPIP